MVDTMSMTPNTDSTRSDFASPLFTLDAAFAHADQLTQELLAERNSFAERKSWRGVLVGGR